MIIQTEFTLRPRKRGCHLITNEIVHSLPNLPEIGLLHLFLKHTSAALTLNENADPDVKHDLLAKMDALIPHHESYYLHGEGNSAAHLKSTLTGVSLTLPVVNGRLHLGVWQGVYFCEFDGPRTRHVELFFLEASPESFSGPAERSAGL